jgi:hypothetical protein
VVAFAIPFRSGEGERREREKRKEIEPNNENPPGRARGFISITSY